MTETHSPVPTRTWKTILGSLSSSIDLTSSDTSWAMNEIMTDNATAAQIAAFGVALKIKGPTPDEVHGLADTMLAHAGRVDGVDDAVDVVGTGGDGADTVNISTMAAMVVASTGARVVKHGNRAASSQSGTTDVLEALGVKFGLGPDGVAACVRDVGIGFCFAPVYHPALRFAGPARKEIGIPTVFNVLGPLTNPGRPRSGLIGCAFESLVPVVADVFAARGTSAVVVRGDDGLDEITLSTTTTAYVVSGGVSTATTIDPRDLGFDLVPISELKGGDAEYNARVVHEVFSGVRGPVRDAVLLNAAAALAAHDGMAGGIDADNLTSALADKLGRAADAIDSGATAALLERWVTRSNEVD